MEDFLPSANLMQGYTGGMALYVADWLSFKIMYTCRFQVTDKLFLETELNN